VGNAITYYGNGNGWKEVEEVGGRQCGVGAVCRMGSAAKLCVLPLRHLIRIKTKCLSPLVDEDPAGRKERMERK